MSIDFYERKIKELEGVANEKSNDLERLNRAWKQKFDMLKELGHQSRAHDEAGLPAVDVEFRLDEFEANYLARIEQLDNLVHSLREELQDRSYSKRISCVVLLFCCFIVYYRNHLRDDARS